MDAHQHSKINISQEQAEEIERIYDDLLGMVKKLSGKAEIKAISESIANVMGFIIERLSEDAPLLLYISKIFDKDYIYAHSLNVCLLSVKFGLKLRFEKNRLNDLGFLALIHARKDIGFPEGLSKKVKHDKKLDEIIKLTDVYDALTHPPAYRHTMTPFETLTAVIDTDKFFDRRLIKILLDELSVYPKGSWVQLSTREIGKVVKVSKEVLLRPTLEIFIDWEGKHLKETRIVDLSKNNVVYVLRPLTEEEVKNIK